MIDKRKFYINGSWIDPLKKNDFDVINPSNEKPYATISIGNKGDVDLAVKAAKKAFITWSQVDKKHKISYIEKGIYNHIRDIFCLSLMFVKMLSKNKKIRILDYGSNALAYANIVNKVNCKNISFKIFDPFYKHRL